MLEVIMSRIKCGYLLYRYKGQNYRIYYPDRDIEYEGNLIYEDVLNNIDLKSVEHLSVLGKTWDGNKEKSLEECGKIIEELKVTLYENFFIHNQAKSIRLHLAKEQSKQSTLIKEKSGSYTYSKQGVADDTRLVFFIQNSTYTNGKLYEWDSDLSIAGAKSYWISNMIPEVTIRELARSDIWSQYSTISKNPLGIPYTLNHDQVRLMTWTNIYSGVRRAQDCPPDAIIEDDDALDGYLIKTRGKRSEKDDDVNSLVSGRNQQKGEVYILPRADTLKYDIEKIESSNDARGGAIKEARLSAIKKAGRTMKHGEMPDVRREIMMRLNRERGT